MKMLLRSIYSSKLCKAQIKIVCSLVDFIIQEPHYNVLDLEPTVPTWIN